MIRTRASPRHWRRGSRDIFLLVTAACLPACTTIVIDEGSERDIVTIGVTRLVVPERQGDLTAFKQTSVGLGYGNAVGDAAWLGFNQGEWVLADPAQCQLLVIIKSGAEADNAAAILKKLEGENICYVNDTQP